MTFSIITATYNSARTLRGTFDSILCQTYKNFEYIVVDGCSGDETLDIINEYVSKFNGRLKWISEKDRGIYDAMNKGISMASGDIVGILNSDDFYASNDVLESIASEFNADDQLEGVYADVTYVKWNDTSKIVRRYSSASFTRNKIRYGLMPAHPTLYLRKNCYEKYGLYDLSYKIGADYDMIIRIFWNGGIKAKYIPRTFVKMRSGGASSSGLSSFLAITKDHMNSVRRHKVPSNYLLQSLRYFGKIIDLIKK